MSDKMRALAASQEKIGWQNFTEGYISWHVYNIQRFHLSMSTNFLNGSNWTKQFITKILQITHFQWIYRNISLHDKRQGYLHTKQSEDLIQEITELSELSPNKVPETCRFLLEVNFTKLTSSHLETQWYWTLAMNAALAARQLERKKGAQSKQTHLKVNRKIPSQKKLGIEAIKQQIQLDRMHKPPTQTAQMTSTKAPKLLSPPLISNVLTHHQHSPPSNPTSASARLISTAASTTIVSEATPLACYWLFAEIESQQSETKGDRRPRCRSRLPRCRLAVVRHGNQKDFCLF